MKVFIKSFACAAVLFVLSVFAFAQNPAGEWTRLQSDNGEFSIEMPKNPVYFYDKNGFVYQSSGGVDYQYAEMQMINAADGKTVFRVEIYRVPFPKTYLDFLLERRNIKTSKINSSDSETTIKQTEKTSVRGSVSDQNPEISFISRFIATKTHLYIVSAANRGAKSAATDKFFSSIVLNKNQTGSKQISSLAPLTIADIGEDATGQLKPPAPQQKPNPGQEIKKNATPVLIVSKPFASYTETARRNLTDGVIRLRVTLDKTGRVSKIAIVSGLPDGLNRSAVFAALQIIFIPEEKDGEMVTVTRLIENSFRVGR